ncbi:MAG: response regulator [Rhodospirillaceae bacterium]|nr:response regulator [Rhodospirillaceae bacterium]
MEGAPQGQLPLKAASILVVDDEPFYASLVERILKQAGYANITTLNDAREVAELHAARDFDLILLDVHMPHLSGLEVIERLKAVEQHDYVPVIVMTGDSEIETRFAALAAGAKDFLVKPPRKEEMLSRIRNLLEVRLLTRENEAERDRFQQLLRNILPGHVIDRLNKGEANIVDNCNDVAILFADLVGFSSVCAKLDSQIIVDDLNKIFLAIDRLADAHRIEKIKTVGDAYMAASGLTGEDPEHFGRMADFAVAVMAEIETLQPRLSHPYSFRIGIERGPLIAGVLRGLRSVFDVWGDTVNAAARLQSASTPGKITVSKHFADALDGRFDLELRGELDLRGVGSTEAFFLLPRRG